MIRDLVIVGCGGFGREVADVVDAINRAEPTWDLLGFVDDSPSPENVARIERRGSTLLGAIDSVRPDVLPHFVVGIGDTAARARIAAQLEAAGWAPATLVHPTAALGAQLSLGPGSIFAAHVAVGSDVTIGRHVHLDRGVQIGHDSTVDDFVTAHPAAVVSGGCAIKQSVELGTNCTVLPDVTIGGACIVGAAACVTKSINAGLTVRGVPAR